MSKEKYGHEKNKILKLLKSRYTGVSEKQTKMNKSTELAPRTFIRCFSFITSDYLEYRLLAVIPAIWTKPMHWCGRLLRVLVRVHKLTKYNLLKFILGFSLPPLFKLHQLLCEFLFLVVERRSLLLERQCPDPGTKQLFKNIRLSLHDCVIIVRRL